MGIYGKYSKMVIVLSFIQISVGVLMFALGIAFRLLVCSWITDASFGFWVGVLVYIHTYSLYHLACNSGNFLGMGGDFRGMLDILGLVGNSTGFALQPEKVNFRHYFVTWFCLCH